jgi:sugar lactone lactonase YvrE
MLLRITFRGVAVVVALLALAGGTLAVRDTSAQAFPEVIPLPDGWQPEGIVVGTGATIYSGSRANGGIYAADLRTGEGEVLVPPQEDRVAIGLSFDARTGYIFVAGGPGGAAYVYDSRTGEPVAEYALPICGPTFVNDVVVTRDAAYLTDSQCAVIYRIPLGPGGTIPDAGSVEAVPLSGDYQHQPGFNANGIDASSNGEHLIVVQSNTGLLYRVDPTTGEAMAIDLGGELVRNGDGILLRGHTLYVVRNTVNIVTTVRLSPDLLDGEVIEETTSPLFRVPTTIANHGSRLYVVNARFGVEDPDDADYDIVQVP